MPERDANQLAADVREALQGWDDPIAREGYAVPALAALDELVALVGTLQEAVDRGERICILPPSHPEAHPWDGSGMDANQLAADVPEVRAVLEMVRALRLELPTAVADDVARRVDELVGLVGTLQREVLRCESEIDQMDSRRADEWERAEAAEAALATTRQALTDIELATHAGAALNHIGWVARRALADTGGDTAEPCTNCDGLGHNTSWPHTTCPVCGGTGGDTKEPA